MMNLTPTANRMGYMHTGENPATVAFFADIIKNKGAYVDVGMAYGHSTLLALKLGADKVLAIDLESQHVQSLIKECPIDDRSRLQAQVAHFPDGISLGLQKWDGIHLCRVLIFLTPSQIQKAFNDAYDALKKDGKIYILSASIYNTKVFPVEDVIKSKQQKNDPWPGYIEDLWEKSQTQKEFFPNKILLLDEQCLLNCAKAAGFKILSSGYWDQQKEVVEINAPNVFLIAQK